MTSNTSPEAGATPSLNATQEAPLRDAAARTATPDDSPTEARSAAISGEPEQPQFAVGESVLLLQRPPYLKSADPMPMLRPPDLIDEGETGVVVELRPQQQRAVRFRRGTFLLTTAQLRRLEAGPEG